MEKKFDYTTFIVELVDKDDQEFLTQSINSFADIGTRLHSVIPKIENGTTVSYLVIMESEF